MQVEISNSDKQNKRYKAVIIDDDSKKTIHFGDSRYDNYTIHNDDNRKDNYINRHKKREDWNITGIKTSGFYSKYLLWNKKTIQQSFNDMKKNYPTVKFILKI